MEEFKKDFKLSENPELNNYIKELNSDIQLSLANLREKSLMVSTIRAKWLSYFMKEKENLERIKALKVKIIKKKLENPQNKSSVLRLKSETKIEESDENIKKLNLLLNKTQSNIEFIERTFNILDNFGFQIKNCIDILKLEKM